MVFVILVLITFLLVILYFCSLQILHFIELCECAFVTLIIIDYLPYLLPGLPTGPFSLAYRICFSFSSRLRAVH